jgi:hypothetical protein
MFSPGRFCPTGRGLTSPVRRCAAPQPAAPQRFFHHTGCRLGEEKVRFRVQGVFMRTVLLGLLLLAGLKVWFQDHTYRVAMADAVVEAYRDRAVEVCRRSATKGAPGSRDSRPNGWGMATSAEAVIGNPDIRVAIWDTQNPLWDQRFRDPHLVLTSTAAGARCSYDLRGGVATLSVSAR